MEEEVDEFGIPIKQETDEFDIPKRKVDEFGVTIKADSLIKTGWGQAYNPRTFLGPVGEFFQSAGSTAKSIVTDQIPQALASYIQRQTRQYADNSELTQEESERLGRIVKGSEQYIQQQQKEFSESVVGIPQSYKNVNTVEDFAKYMGGLVGQSGGQIIPSLLSGGASSYLQESQAVYRGQLERIADEKGITVQDVISRNLDDPAVGQAYAVAATGLDIFSNLGLTKPLVGLKGWLRKTLTEAVTEPVQGILEEKGAGYDLSKTINSKRVDEAIGGFVGGGLMSSFSSGNVEQDTKAKIGTGLVQAEEAIEQLSSGNPEIDAQIDAEAQIDPVDKQVLEEAKIAEAVVEEQAEVEKQEKLEEALAENNKPKPAEGAEKVEKPLKPSQTPEYKIALDKVTKLQEQFAALPIEENADQLLFDLREARQALQKIAGKPASKASDIKKTIDVVTGVAKPEKSVKLTPQEAVVAQIKIQDRGIKIGRDLTQSQVVSKIKDAAKEANLSPKQTQSLASRAEKVSLTPKSIEKYNEYVQKVVQDANYTDKISTAETLRKTIRKKSKNATPQEKQTFKEFLQVNPEDVNVDEYIKVAEETTKGFKSPTDKNYKPLKLKTINEFTAGEINSVFSKEFPENTEVLTTSDKLSLLKQKRADERREAQNDRLRAKLEKDFSPEEVNSFMEALSSETDVDSEITDLNKKEQVRQVFKQLADQRQKDLPEIEELSAKEQEILNSLKTANLSDLTAGQLKLFIQLSDRITENEDFGKAGFLPVILKAQEEYKKLEKLDLNILNITDFEQEISANLPAVFRAITGLPQDAAKFQLYLGIKGLNDSATSSVKASEDFVQKLNDMNDEFTKTYGSGRNGFTDESIFRQGIYAELIKHDATINPDEFLVKNKEAIEATISSYREAEKTQEANAYDKLFAPFRKAKTLQEVTDIMKKSDPAGKRVVEFIIDYMKPYGQRVNESNLLYYNKPTQDIANYAGESAWYRVAEVAKQENINESDLKDIDDLGSYRLKPANPKQDRSQMEFKRIIPKGKVLDFNLHHRVNRQIQRVHFKTEAAPYLLQVREMIKNTERMKKVLGGGVKSDQLYGKLFNTNSGAYFKFENNLLNKGDIPTAFDRSIRNITGTLRKWGYNLRLGGLTQWAKQPTVLINTMVQTGDPSLVVDTISEIYADPEGYKAFVKDQTVSMRGEQKSLFNIGDSYIASLDKNLKNEINEAFTRGIGTRVERVFENNITGIGALVRADKFAANPSFVAFYKKHLKDIGQPYLGFTEEVKLRNTPERQEALAVAKQMLDDLQVVSNPAEMVAKMQSDRDYKSQVAKAILFPFGGFSTSTKQRLFSDWRAIATGNSKQREYAIKDITATFAEQTVFQTINQFALGFLWEQIGELYEWAFDLPEDDDEEKYKQWWQRTWTGMLLDNLPLILTNPGEEILEDGINYSGYTLYKYRTGEELTYKQYAKDVGLPITKYTKPDESSLDKVLDWLGPLAAPIQNIVQGVGTLSDSRNEDLTPEQRRFAGVVAVMQFANFIGVWPSDVTSGTLKELREQKRMNRATGGSGGGEIDEPTLPEIPEVPNLPELPVLE